MIAIKKDFVPEDTRSYCNNGFLRSGKAYFMKDNNGIIHYGGEICAKNKTNTDLTKIPDLTRALIKSIAGNQGNGGGNGDNGTSTITDKSRAITYLVLREEKLVNWLFIQNYRFTQLTDLYNNYIQNNDLTQQEVSSVLFYINNSKKIDSKLSLENLETCYAYDYILERALTHVNNRVFIEGLLANLKDKCYLTNAQINGLDKWLEHLPQMEECHLRNFN